MELFVEPGQTHTFLLELILAYLKLEDRHRVKLVTLSPVTTFPFRQPSKQ